MTVYKYPQGIQENEGRELVAVSDDWQGRSSDLRLREEKLC